MRGSKFNTTRDQERGYGMDLFYFQNKYESTNYYEDDENLNNHNREVLKDYGPDRIGFAYEEPRRNTGSRERLNLQHAGIYGSETAHPWRNDDYDINFTDKDKRGHLEDHNWQLFRQNNEQRFKLQPFRNDQDWSIPSNGVHPTTMSERLFEIRRQLKSRLNWFDESLDNFAGGRTFNSYNNPHGDTVMEDIDLGVSDANNRNPANRVMSNYMNTGGNYFFNYFK